MKLKSSQTLLLRVQNRQKRNKIETEIKSKAEGIYDRDIERKMNRVSFKRFQEQIDRGYDPFKTGKQAVYGGYNVRAQREDSAWDQIGGGNGTRNNLLTNTYSSNNTGIMTSREPSSAPMVSSRNNIPNTTRANTGKVPSLDLTKTQGKQNVSYNEPNSDKGGIGTMIPMSVRTGGRI